MRAIKATLPMEYADRTREIAFQSGVSGVNVTTVKYFSKSGKQEEKASVSFETSTPKVKIFIDAMLGSDFFDPQTCSISSRERRAIIGSESLEEVTYPFVAPGVDVCQELFLFSHVTVGFVGRVFAAGCLLAYGVLHQNLLLMIAGMMFLPLLPVMLGIGFSAWIWLWNFTWRAVAALVVALASLLASGVIVGALSQGPIRYDDFAPVYVGAIISLVVGVAAGLGTTDDGGRREMIGLAATAQIAIIPSWLGLVIAQGVPPTSMSGDVEKRILSLVLNIVCVIVAALVIFIVTRTAHASLRKLSTK